MRRLIAGLALALVACSGSAPAAGPTSTVAEPAPVTTSQASAVTTTPKAGMSADEIAVRNLIDREAAEFAAALDPPDPPAPGSSR